MNDRLPSNQGRRATAAIAALLALLAAGPVYPAQSQTPAQSQLQLKASGPAASAPQVVVKDNVVELSLEQVVELALAQNLGIVIQRYNRQQAALGVYQSLGIYDLLGSADLTATDRKNLAASIFDPTRQKTEALTFGVSQLIPTGGTLGISSTNTRTEQVFSIPTQQFLNPSYRSGVNVNYTQPLLRNFGRLSVEHQLTIARANSAISRQEFERQATLILQQVIDAYWNLVEARAQLGVAQESLGLARELHERNKIQVQVGTLAPLELVQSEAQIATNEENIITAQANLANAADALRQLVNLQSGELWDKEIRPVTDAQTEHITVNLADAVKTAFDRRPEIRSQAIAVERFKNDAAFFHGQKKPQLDLIASYGFNGLAPSFSRAYSQIDAFDLPGWSGELRFSIPIQNRAARAQSVIADLDYEKARVQLDSLHSQVLTEVRTAARGVDTAAKQIDAAMASRNFQAQNLDAERKKYENGMSTSFEITRIQSDLTQARSREVSAIVQYRRALVEYYRATGRLLDVQGIVVADDEPPVHRFSFHNSAIEGYEPNRQPPPVVKEGQPNTPAQPGTTAQPNPPAPPANPPAPPPTSGQGNGSHGGQ